MTASAAEEKNFKVCGLCSQLVDESVQLDDRLREFLLTFLGVTGEDFPIKICTDCFQGATDVKRFHEGCLRAIKKIHRTNLSASMILGKSPRAAPAVKGTLPKSANVNMGLGPLPPEEKLPPRRSSRPPAPSSTSPSLVVTPGKRALRSPPSKRKEHKVERIKSAIVKISKNERQKAENVLNQKKPAPNPSVKKSSRVAVAKKVKSATPPPPPLVEEAVSSSGRKLKRTIKRGFVYDKELEEIPSPSPPPSKRRRKGSLPQRTASVTPSVPKGGRGSSPPEEELDDVEIFPSIGPYQCEICQKITDTKLQFVNHIKQYHRSVVDEEVLRSLEQDLKKVQRKLKDQQKDSQSQSSAQKKKPQNGPVKPSPVKKPVKTPNKATSSGKKSNKKKTSPKTPSKKLSEEEDKAKRTCTRCHALIPRASDMKRHQLSRTCRNYAKMLEKPAHAIEVDDPAVESVESRTCQYCGKVLEKVKDFESHYSTKACQAKKYELEKITSPENEALDQKEHSELTAQESKENGRNEARDSFDSITTHQNEEDKNDLSVEKTEKEDVISTPVNEEGWSTADSSGTVSSNSYVEENIVVNQISPESTMDISAISTIESSSTDVIQREMEILHDDGNSSGNSLDANYIMHDNGVDQHLFM